MKRTFNMPAQNLFGGAGKFYFVFIAAGIFVWLTPFLFSQENSVIKVLITGAFFVLLGLILRLSAQGLQLNMERKEIREYTSFFGFKFGEWEALPDFRRLRISSQTFSARNTPNGISPSLIHTVKVYTVNLYSDSPKPAFSFRTENEEKAREAVRALSAILNLTVEEKETE